jgi:hypothetical protein
VNDSFDSAITLIKLSMSTMIPALSAGDCRWKARSGNGNANGVLYVCRANTINPGGGNIGTRDNQAD